MRQLGITDMTFRVWIDGQHMTRKLVAHADGTSEQMTVQAQVTGINQTATISAPPRGEVATIPTSKLKS
jgi:VCBS repeat-containing protein